MSTSKNSLKILFKIFFYRVNKVIKYISDESSNHLENNLNRNKKKKINKKAFLSEL